MIVKQDHTGGKASTMKGELTLLNPPFLLHWASHPVHEKRHNKIIQFLLEYEPDQQDHRIGCNQTIIKCQPNRFNGTWAAYRRVKGIF